MRDDGPEVFAAKSIAAHSTALDKVNARAYGSFRSFVEDIDLIVRNALAYRRDVCACRSSHEPLLARWGVVIALECANHKLAWGRRKARWCPGSHCRVFVCLFAQPRAGARGG